MTIQATSAVARPDLALALREYTLDRNKFIADLVFPELKKRDKAGAIRTVTRESLLRYDASGAGTSLERAPGTEFARRDVELDELQYECKQYGLEAPLADEEREEFGQEADIETIVAESIEHDIMLEREIRVASACFNTTTFTGAALFTDNKSNPWSTAATDILAQIEAAKELVEANCGMTPNALTINKTTYRKLIKNTAIRAALGDLKDATYQEVANLIAPYLDLEFINVGAAMLRSSRPGQTFTSSRVWSSAYALLSIQSSPNALQREPSLGRSIVWEKDGGMAVNVEQYREEKIKSDIYRVWNHLDELMIDPLFGHLMQIETI